MGQSVDSVACYVVRAEDLTALNYLPVGHPRPRSAEWINRGTDQKLRRTTIDMFLRTFFANSVSPSAIKLRESTGLRLSFRSDGQRRQFSEAFGAARHAENKRRLSLVVAMFDGRDPAQAAIARLKVAGVPERAMSLLWRAGQFMDTAASWPEGHSKLSVAMSVAGGGFAGALLGIGILALPGIGPIAAAGSMAAAAFGSVAAAGGTIGATGGAFARMISDNDVDEIAEAYFEQQFRHGKVFVSVDLDLASDRRETIENLLSSCGGHINPRGHDNDRAFVAPPAVSPSALSGAQ